MASVNGKKKGSVGYIKLTTPCKIIKCVDSNKKGHDLRWGYMGIREAETFFNAQRIINKALKAEPNAVFQITCDVDDVHYVGDFDFSKAKIKEISSAKQMVKILRVELTK